MGVAKGSSFATFAAVTVAALALGGCSVPTQLDAARGFINEVDAGRVAGIKRGDHTKFDIYDFDVARSRSGLTCAIVRVTPAGAAEATEYLMTRLPGEKAWSIGRVGGPTTQPSMATAN